MCEELCGYDGVEALAEYISCDKCNVNYNGKSLQYIVCDFTHRVESLEHENKMLRELFETRGLY